ncbi:hypothetical protein B296_00008604 [Ensete ventricosum]|uniref:Uncharacterized protein n=1 Tax=Ensete ventricosum TaxID=4639 RepID=A0A427B481_ENSVE|nr:hypothetical protein B296_00008604 [Ensete ventricosum]
MTCLQSLRESKTRHEIVELAVGSLLGSSKTLVSRRSDSSTFSLTAVVTAKRKHEDHCRGLQGKECSSQSTFICPRSGSLLLVLLAAFPAPMATSDAPFMVAHKKVSLTRLKSGVERVSVSLSTCTTKGPRE